MSSITVSDAAREIGCNVTPRDISALFYKRALRDDIAPIVSGRRMIPRDYLDVIRMELRRAGKLSAIKREVAHAV
jgi:hypothetical protein